MGGNNHGKEYNLRGEMIPHDKEKKDLGVMITEDGKPSRQSAAASNKVMCKLGIIKRTFKHFDKKCFTTCLLYRTYIPPHPEYAVQAWSPYLKKRHCQV